MKNRDYAQVKDDLTKRYQEITEELEAIPVNERKTTVTDSFGGMKVVPSPGRQRLLNELDAIASLKRQMKDMALTRRGRR